MKQLNYLTTTHMTRQLNSRDVAHLGPSFLVPDLALVLEVGHDLGLAWQGPHQPPTVRSRELLGRTDADVGLVDVRGGVVHQVDQQPHELVHYVLVFVVV